MSIVRVTFIHAIEFAGDTRSTWTEVACAAPNTKGVASIKVAGDWVELRGKNGEVARVPVSNVRQVDSLPEPAVRADKPGPAKTKEVVA